MGKWVMDTQRQPVYLTGPYSLFNSIHATTGLIINVCSAWKNSHTENIFANICTVKIFCKQKVDQQTANTHSDSYLALVRFLSSFSIISKAQGSPLLFCLTDDYSNCSVNVYVDCLLGYFRGCPMSLEIKWNETDHNRWKRKIPGIFNLL